MSTLEVLLARMRLLDMGEMSGYASCLRGQGWVSSMSSGQ